MNYPVSRSVGRALPANYYPQEVLSTALWNEWSRKVEDRALFERLQSIGAVKEPSARQPKVVASRSMFFHDTEQMMV